MQLLVRELHLPSAVNIVIARQARVSQTEVCSRSDIVLFSSPDDQQVRCGEVWTWAHISGQGIDWSIAIISEWTVQAKTTDRSCVTYEIRQDLVKTVCVTDIYCAVTYRRQSQSRAQILVPTMYRDML